MKMKQVFSTYGGIGEDQLGQFKYCPFCGSKLKLKKRSGKDRPACPDCEFVQYRNPIPGVVVVIEKDSKVLLGKRAGRYGKGKWGLPQGYIEFDEDFIGAAIREVKEETGLDVEIESILNVVSNFLSPRLHTVAIIMRACMKGGELCARDDLNTVEWFPLAGPLPEMAFEADKHIIEKCHRMNIGEGIDIDPGATMKGVLKN